MSNDNNKDLTDAINDGDTLHRSPMISTDSSASKIDVNISPIDKYHLPIRWNEFIEKLRERKAGGFDNIPTGIPGLDEKTGGGYPRGAISLLCGPPGISKTTLAINNSLHAARNKDPVVFWTYELEPEDLQARMVCIKYGVDWGAVRCGMHNDLATQMLDEIRELPYYELPYYIVGRHDCRKIDSLVPVVATATEQNNGKSPLVIVDHVQLLMDSTTRDQRSAADRVADKLLSMAIETKAAVLAISSVGRDKYDLASKGPPPLGRVLSMAKESGRFESDAVLQMGMSPVLVPNAERTAETNIWLSIAKSRFGGGVGNIMLRYNGRSGTFEEVDPETVRRATGTGRPETDIRQDILKVTREHDLPSKKQIKDLVMGNGQVKGNLITCMLADKILVKTDEGFIKPASG